MPKRFPAQHITVVRKGEQVTPPIGKGFEFSKEEIDHIEAVNPDAFAAKVSVDTEDLEDTAAQAAGRPVVKKTASAEGL